MVGAAGPPAVGLLHELQGGGTLPLLECAGLALVMARAGWLAGRDLQIN
jgi:CP family cyanate transporter-like MFS transporter